MLQVINLSTIYVTFQSLVAISLGARLWKKDDAVMDVPGIDQHGDAD